GGRAAVGGRCEANNFGAACRIALGDGRWTPRHGTRTPQVNAGPAGVAGFAAQAPPGQNRLRSQVPAGRQAESGPSASGWQGSPLKKQCAMQSVSALHVPRIVPPNSSLVQAPP